MKKIILLLTIFFGSFQLAQAQNGQPPKGERVQALYIAYITQQLKLSEADAQKFWPIYNQYDAEMKGVSSTLSELEKQQAMLNIKKKYQEKFSKIVGNDRADLFFVQDNEFRTKMVDRLRKNRLDKDNRK